MVGVFKKQVDVWHMVMMPHPQLDTKEERKMNQKGKGTTSVKCVGRDSPRRVPSITISLYTLEKGTMSVKCVDRDSLRRVTLTNTPSHILVKGTTSAQSVARGLL